MLAIAVVVASMDYLSSVLREKYVKALSIKRKKPRQ
jgi:hypothetical protein